MDSSVSRKDQFWFLRMCHHVSDVLYLFLVCFLSCFVSLRGRAHARTHTQTDTMYTKLFSLVGENCHSSVGLLVINSVQQATCFISRNYRSIYKRRNALRCIFWLDSGHTQTKELFDARYLCGIFRSPAAPSGGGCIVSIQLYSVFLMCKTFWTQESVVGGVLISP